MDRPSPPSRQQLVSKVMVDLLNQVFEIEKKLARIDEQNSIDRNLQKIKDFFTNGLLGDIELVYENPLGEPYDETRTDCEASIAGESAENLVIIEVIKPIIRQKKRGLNRIVQKGIVIVESQDQQSADE